MRSFIQFAVDKNVLNYIFLLFLILLAVFSYRAIPKEIFPPSNLGAISISGGYSGASPDVLDKIIVQKIEDDLANLNHVDRVESTIRNGSFTIMVYLKRAADSSKILDDIRGIISSKQKDLPSDMSEPTARVMQTNYPLISIAIASEDSPKKMMLEVAEDLKSRLSKLEDLSDINIQGDVDKELLFKINKKKLNAYGLDTKELIVAISSLSEVFPIGIIQERGDHLFVSTYGGEVIVENISNTILHVGGKKIRLGEVASAELKFSDPKELSRFNGEPNITISVSKSKEGNSIALVEEIREILEDFEQKHTLFTFEIYSDSSVWIRNRLNTVTSNIIFGLILVGLSVWIFINGRIAFVVSIGIPISFMIGLISANFMGYSLNMLSLLGALIALGMLVDQSIVVAENIHRHLENGVSSREATINGATEMFPAVLISTATTIFSFLPLLIMSGEIGVFMKILPIMVSILLLSSFFQAFYFLPLYSKDFLKVKKTKRKIASLWTFLNSMYTKILIFLLTYKRSTLSIFLILIISLIVILGKHSKFQLFPDFDTTQIFISGKIDINSRLKDTQEAVSQIEKILLSHLSSSEVASIASISGFMLDSKYIPHYSENNFHIFVDLYERVPENAFNRYINPHLSPEYDDSRMKRDRSADEILVDIKKLTLELSQSGIFEEFKAYVPGAGLVANDLEIAISGDDDLVKKAIDELTKKMQSISGTFNIQNDLRVGKRELKLKINSYGELLGFNERAVSSLLRPLFFSAEISKMFYNDELIKVRSQAKARDYFETINSLYISTPDGQKRVRLSEVVDFKFKEGFANIFKDDGNRISSIFASLDKSEVTSSEILDKLKPLLERFEKRGLRVLIKGEEKENKRIQQEMGQAALIALFLIFIALVWMFNSVLLSTMILTTIPLSILGVLAGHMLMGINMTMPGLLGIVGLSGVVINGGILMIDFIKKAKNLEEVIAYGSMRLRPILLTSITTILGLSTLIFFASGQAVILQPVAISLGFGLAFATILNLFYLPVLYTLIKDKKLKG